MTSKVVQKVLLAAGVVGTLGLVAWTSSMAMEKAQDARTKGGVNPRQANLGGSMWSRMDREIKTGKEEDSK